MSRQRRKMPSFSSSLLEAIYQSIDEQPNPPRRRNIDDEIESLRRAIMVEKWMENYSHSSSARARHLPSNSSSSTDSIESDSPKLHRNKSKKLKEPVSPGARIASFLNSIFSPRNKDHPVRKSRSMKDSGAAATAASRSCLTINKSKRCVRFCPLVHQDSLVYKERDFDDKSCASSDLFELENIGPYHHQLPVYATTDLKINRAMY
ncbi:protein BIG GRAIN 1-like [Salvia miltiorrhiza]|uniref:protein BIG GRAIN 1-like n=1 Tax=Salvia miltiorrhiza TaxID=226208 RepID=UPI0025AC3DBC|nr:protein BIG GRAIN 1-like [Salvia miltiorrhiza]